MAVVSREAGQSETGASGYRAYAVLQARWLDARGPAGVGHAPAGSSQPGGAKAVDELDVTRARLRIGRHDAGRTRTSAAVANDVVVENAAISGEHLELDFSEGRPLVCDLGSRNGSYLDGRRLAANQRTPLAPGSVLRLGGVLELIVLPPDPSRRALATPRQVHLVSEPKPGLIVEMLNVPDARGPDARGPDARAWAERVALPEREVKIGRRPENDIVIDNPAVSGVHAKVIPHAAGQFQIVDLQSRNGLRVHGQAFTSKPLRPGEGIHIGDQVRLEFRPAMCFISSAPGGKKTPAAATQFLDLTSFGGAEKTIRIGRAGDNDLRIDDSRVSRYHAVLERVGARYRIRDLRSDGGTFVNGKRVDREQFVQEGDVIHIANVKLKFAEDGLQQTDTRGLRLDLLGLHKVVDRDKDLLQDISLSIYPREFVALVGTSGAGKSTLLDAMNGFRPASQGQVLVNGVSLYEHFDAYRTEMGYVPQDDIMHRELTVYEALDYAARLRLPADTSPAERAARIKQVLRDLDLEARADLPIHKLSGGQRKRVSIGIELITRPSLFFLDEATSGLDPGTELELMQLLRQLTEDLPDGGRQESRTIILITHATKNVMLCDQVIFLTKGGYLAFFGPPDKALEYFDQYRNQVARRLKPDFEFDDIYNLIDVDKALPEKASEKEKLALAAEWARRYRQSSYYQKYVAERLGPALGTGSVPPVQAPAAPQGPSAERRRPRASAWRQFWILSARYWSVVKRDRKGLAILLLQAPLIGLSSLLTMGGAKFDRVNGSASQALTALFLAIIIVLLFGTVNSSREFTKEMAVYKRERMVNLKLGPYVFSKVFVGLLFCLYQVAIYLLFTLVSTDWPQMNMAEWTAIYFTLSLASLTGVMLGLLLSALSNTDGQAVALIPVILIPQFILAGILMPELGKAPVAPTIATSRWATTALATITRADLAGTENPDVAEQIVEAKEKAILKAISDESGKAVTAELEKTVQDKLPGIVKDQVDQQMATQTRAAEAQAEAEVRRRMSQQLTPQGQPIPPAMVESEVAKAKQQARRNVAAKRPEIEAAVRKTAEENLRPRVEKEIRDRVAAEVRVRAEEEAPPENPVLKQTYDYFGDIFHENLGKNWTAMIVILAVLLAVILVLQKRKDVI